MATEYQSPQSLSESSTPKSSPKSRYPIWPALLVLAIFWCFNYAFGQMELSMFGRFVTRMSAYAVLALFTLGWWLFNRRFSRRDRWLTIAVGLGVWLLAGMVSDMSVDLFSSLIFNAHVAFTLGLLWLLVAQGMPTAWQRNGLWVTFGLVWGTAALFRFDGLSGGQDSKISWRWSPTAEERFLASRTKQDAATPANVPEPTATLEVTAQDWPEFRGPRRDSQVHGLEIDTDWAKNPPRKVWRQPVGPGWSSMIIVGSRLFTQEQRGEEEAVVCYDADTGRELWVHSDPVRFFEALAGAGPRATPTFSQGRIYTLGGTGLLNCLDAATGKPLWKADIAKDAEAPTPQWGFSGSPLVEGKLVLAYAGGKGKSLLAYDALTGEPAWSSATGTDGYSSPQLASIGGHEDILMLCDTGLFAVRPTDGDLLGKLPETGVSMPVVQPQPAGDDKFVIQANGGLALVSVNLVDDELEVTSTWASQALKPSLNDFIIHEGAIYGFDDGIFVCLSLETGKRLWKNGRFGHGQVLMLADQGLLLVLCETGEVVLLKANPKKLEELGRFTAIAGKTWNHPAVSGNRLYVRNGEEMACYELKSSGSAESNDRPAVESDVR